MDLEKAEVTDQIANILWIIEKAKQFQKDIYFCFIDYAKAFECVDQKLENSQRDGNTRPPYLPPEKAVCRSRRNRTGHGTMDLFQTGKRDIKAVYYHPVYLIYMKSTSCEMPGWMNHKLESRFLEEKPTTSDVWMIPL